jgi:hypothetical protein
MIEAAYSHIGNQCTPEMVDMVILAMNSFSTSSLPVQYGCRRFLGYVINEALHNCLDRVEDRRKSAFDRKAPDYSKEVQKEQCLAAQKFSRFASKMGATQKELDGAIGKCSQILEIIEKELHTRKK